MKKYYKSIYSIYILMSYVLILPLAVLVLFSSLSLDGDSEEWNQRAEATVITCRDVTHRTKGEYENGGPSLSYEVEAVFEVNGKPYLVSTSGGQNYQIGSKVVISYNSENPEKNYWSADPNAESSRMRKLFVISGILFILAGIGCVKGTRDRRRKKKTV